MASFQPAHHSSFVFPLWGMPHPRCLSQETSQVIGHLKALQSFIKKKTKKQCSDPAQVNCRMELAVAYLCRDHTRWMMLLSQWRWCWVNGAWAYCMWCDIWPSELKSVNTVCKATGKTESDMHDPATFKWLDIFRCFLQRTDVSLSMDPFQQGVDCLESCF